MSLIRKYREWKKRKGDKVFQDDQEFFVDEYRIMIQPFSVDVVSELFNLQNQIDMLLQTRNDLLNRIQELEDK